jgi:hypothetical protein
MNGINAILVRIFSKFHFSNITSHTSNSLIVKKLIKPPPN